MRSLLKIVSTNANAFSTRRNKVVAISIVAAIITGSGLALARSAKDDLTAKTSPVVQYTAKTADDNLQPSVAGANTASSPAAQSPAPTQTKKPGSPKPEATTAKPSPTQPAQTNKPQDNPSTAPTNPIPVTQLTTTGIRTLTITPGATTGYITISTSDGRSVKWLSATMSFTCDGVPQEKIGPIYMVMDQPNCAHFGPSIGIRVHADSDTLVSEYPIELAVYAGDEPNNQHVVHSFRVYVVAP